MKGIIATAAAFALASTMFASSVLASSMLVQSTDSSRRWVLGADGTWRQVEQAAADVRPEARRDPRLDEIESMIDRGQYKPAFKALVVWLKNNRSSPGRDRALLLAAESLRGHGNGIKAFYYCDELMDTYPASPLYPEALQLQYDIADEYLNGRKERLFGLRIVGREEEGLDILYRVQQRVPASPLAERSLLRSADYFWADGQFDLAADAYGAYVRAYPRSPLVPAARLREAYSNLAQVRTKRGEPLYDATPIINAKVQLLDLTAQYPELAQQENLPAKIELADQLLAQKLLWTANYYRRTHKPDSAVHVADRLLLLYPNAPEADDARQLIDRLNGGEAQP